MDSSKIVEIFKVKAKKKSSAHPLLKSSVLVPIIEVKNEPHILFQVRSYDMKTQPGEICFPGGKVEKNETLQQSAIRETVEELNVSQDHIEVIGKLDPIVTTFNMIIYPFCGVLHNLDLQTIHFNEKEVDSLFTVPIKDLLSQKPLVHKLKIDTIPDESFPFHLIQNGDSYRWRVNDYYVYFYIYKDYVIWGITAKILKNFLDILSD
ncbi:NUDIX domain-containing protein [Natronincola peptidivorans]|uniref:NUDIX domain-containing protein n=1 Tax=Natronincola peptidivorans TaxID=426128 RepID=A0A1H9Y604_9FIRM|nr:CoA pyrophosphatase [Natronincola peptidivorans]SES64241.1 NUDIX domain-containing protein [Natronincola peptidivorans]